MRTRVLTAVLLICAFALPAQVWESRRYFSLASSETVLPGRAAPVRVSAQGVNQLEFRLYRLKDPRAFFVKLGSTSTARRTRARLFAPRTPIERFDAWRQRQYAKLRDLVRMQFTAANRAQIRAWMQEREAKKAAQEKKAAPAEAAPSFAGAPLLNPDLLVKRWTQPVRARTRWEPVTVHVPLAEAGVYVLEATDEANHAYTVLVATPLGVIVKAYPGQAAVRVVDRMSGAPRSGCGLELLDAARDQSFGKRTTGGDGGALFAVEGSWEDQLLLIADCGGVQALAKAPAYAVAPRWGGIEGAIHTDRPVYRPGQKVRYRAVVREVSAGEYRKPGERKVRIKVEDSQGNPVVQKTISLTKYGTASGQLDLPEDAPLGYFGIQVTPEGKDEGIYGGFHVEEYRKPDYEVRVTPASARTLQGTRTEARIEARYYYGEPVAGAAVAWSVYRYRWYPPWQEWEEAELEDEGIFGGEEVLEGEGRLDAEGRLNIRIALERGEHDYQYRVEARVTDEGGRAIEGAGSFLGTRAPFLLSAGPEKWVCRKGEKVRWVVRTADFEQKPVAAVAFRVEARRRWPGKEEGNPVALGTGKTGAEGEARVEFALPASGEWRVSTVARGPAGDVREDSWMWISGEDSGWKAPERVKLALDRKSYKAGEAARVTVITGVPQADVWMAVEGPTLYWSKFVKMEGGAGTVEIPVQREFAPNVYVTAVFLKDNEQYEGSITLKVPPIEKQISVALEPSKREYQPGEPASLKLTARDHAGRPVRAEFALGVVDEAIYAIQREAQPDLVKVFYGHRWNRVETETSRSFPFWSAMGGPLGLSAAMATAERRTLAQLKREGITVPKIRKDFPDTAFWVADLETDAQGRAEVRFEFPDSLTTWRATARGVTEDTRVGGAVERVLVRKDVVVSLAAPRFFTEGDEAVVPVLARNYTGGPLRVRVGLQAQGVRVVEGRETELQLDPQSEGKAEYRLKAEQAGRATLTATAAGAGKGDGLQITVPVHPYGVPMEAAAQARVEGGGSKTLIHEFPAAEEASGRVAEVRLTPSLGGALLGALEYLLEYPYGCAEQLMSGLLPNLVVAEAMRKLNLETAADRRELDRNVKAGIEKLVAQQNSDGGWGWWRQDDSGLFLTSYILLGLGHARENGYPVRAHARNQAADYIADRIQSPQKTDADLLAYALLALAMDRKLEEAWVARVWERRSEMTGFGWASLGLAMQRMKDARRQAAAERLMGLAKQEGEEVFWPGGRDVMFLHGEEHTFEATAMAARFLALERPESGLAERAAQWLVNHRDRGYYWHSTKRTAFVIYGLIPLLERTGELKPDLTARVLAGGREVLRKRFTAAEALSAKPVKVIVPAGGRRSEIRVETEGRGHLYVSATWRWRQTEAGEPRRLAGAGKLEVDRRYYRLRKVETGGKIEYALEPWSGPARRGDLVAVRVSVRGSGDGRAFVVEDPLPAGAEAVTRDAGYTLRGRPEWWHWWLDRRELRDERAAWFPWWLPERGYETVYLFRFTNAGKFRAAPARVEAMYEPEAKAWSEAAEWEVLP